jgi:hypothetical protein
MKTFSLVAGVAVLLAAASPSYAQSNATCLRQVDIDSFNAPNDTTLIVKNNYHNKFKITLLGTCPSLPFKEGLAFKSFGGTRLSCISAGDSIIERNMGTGPQECPIRKVEPYTPEMEKADFAAKQAKMK